MSKRITNRIYKSILMFFVIMSGIFYSQLTDSNTSNGQSLQGSVKSIKMP